MNELSSPRPAFDLRLLHCRRLFLKNYTVMMHIGIYDFEKAAPQRVVINVDIYLPLAKTGSGNDTIDDVVDYDFIRTEVAKRIQRGHIHLQETLCDDIATAMLAHPLVQAARVSTEKCDVYPDCDSVGVEIFRFKEAA